MIAASAQIIKNHSKRHYNEVPVFQKHSTSELANDFMSNNFMVIKYVEFFFENVNNNEILKTRVLYSIRNIKNYKVELTSFEDIRSD